MKEAKMTNDGKILLPPEQQRQFEIALEIAIAKQLRTENLLTDRELSFVISDLRKQDARAS